MSKQDADSALKKIEQAEQEAYSFLRENHRKSFEKVKSTVFVEIPDLLKRIKEYLKVTVIEKKCAEAISESSTKLVQDLISKAIEKTDGGRTQKKEYNTQAYLDWCHDFPVETNKELLQLGSELREVCEAFEQMSAYIHYFSQLSYTNCRGGSNIINEVFLRLSNTSQSCVNECRAGVKLVDSIHAERLKFIKDVVYHPTYADSALAFVQCDNNFCLSIVKSLARTAENIVVLQSVVLKNMPEIESHLNEGGATKKGVTSTAAASSGCPVYIS